MATIFFPQDAPVRRYIGFDANSANSGIPQLMTRGTQTTTNAYNYVISPNSALYVFGGTVPDFSTLTSTAEPILIDFTMSEANNSWQWLGIQDDQTVNARYDSILGACTATTNATNSGIATWFALCSRYLFNGTFSDRAALFGTIGLPGSGADMIMTDTNIVSGAGYTSAGVRVSFPKEWTIA